jgi:phospholipid/cholesterol/gamma-HCH transport system substrate-binding protein
MRYEGREDMKKYSMETIVGIFVSVGLLCVGYMTVKLGHFTVFAEDPNVFYARFNSASGLKVGSPIEIFGIRVGNVQKIEIDSEKDMALVQISLKKGIKVYEDASASIKTAGLIGDKFIKVDPGGSGDLLKNGGVITETSSAFDLEDLIGKYAFGGVKEASQEKKEKKK